MMRRRNEFSIHNLSIIEPNRKVCAHSMFSRRLAHCMFQIHRTFRLWKDFTDQRLMMKFVSSANEVKQKYHDAQQDCSRTDADGLDEKMKLLLKHLNDREQKLVRELQESKAELVKSISAHNSTIAELQKEKKKGDALELQNIVLQKVKKSERCDNDALGDVDEDE
ncbi:hypothetical protein GUITHDRAFT_99194 [Guillardia theta CCMP2712]|uniref:Uncharacterized protein n=1 Tax=Guillardia theta (strain CCMP2712) TaxID=905079 RepID=L1K3N3_GUITC|nr:hypothetical protein GUITHDRAFT_99194 [Guillardia theta CCMP2712]EKX55416.1 hypothetical protein GUITHDRAFT_99194 [Guillardia theta CCMP2712]|eukprot:XP_005842396.1 hypothetical protein GUITHDRAFT_99194 [Guillardia theta CCMP2712]